MKTYPLKSTIAALLMSAAAPLSALTLTWDGGDALNNNWSDTDNWNSLRGAQAGDALVFPAGPADKATVNNLAAGTSLASLLITGGGYSVSGSAFTIAGGGITINVSGAGSAVINPAVTLGARQTWTTATADDLLVLKGTVSLPGLELTCAGAGLVSLDSGCSGTGALTVDMDTGSSGGVRFLSGSSSNYSGATKVLSGVLELGGNGAASIVSVESGGTLGGDGTVYRVLHNGGIIQPGRTAGSLADSGGLIAILSGLTCSGNAHFAFNIGGTSFGTTYDQIRVNGMVQLGGASLNVSLDPGYVPPAGTAFILLSNDGTDAVEGTFAGLPNGAPVMAGGHGFVLFYNGGDGNDVVLIAARTWTAGSVSTAWSNPANWDGMTVPAQGDYLVFPDLGAPYSCSNDLVPGRMYGSIAVAGDVTSAAGNEISLQHGITAVAGSFSWDTELKLLGFQSFTGISSRISVHKVNLNGFTLIMDCMTAGASDSVSVSGDAGGDLYGSGSIIARGPGKKYLGGANSYTGLTSVEEGTLDLQRSTSLGAAGSPCVVAAGAQLAMTTSYVTVVPNPLTLRGTLFIQGPGVQTFSGPVTLEGTPAVTASNSTAAALTGPVSGSGSLTKSGAGTLTLGGAAANTFTGGCTVTQGDLLLDKSGVVAIPGTVTLGFGSTASTLRQMKEEQFGPGAHAAVGSRGILDLNGFDCGLAALELTGGSVTGVPGRLRLAGGLSTHAAAETATISAAVLSTPALAAWQVEDGAADPDFLMTGVAQTTGTNTVQKHGAGSAQFTGGQNLQRLRVSAGEVQWNATGSSTLQCDGGTITGIGACGLLTGLAGGGTVSPGGSGPALFTCSSAALPANATVKLDIAGTTPGTGCDQLICASQPVLNNPALQITVPAGFNPSPGTSFTIVKNNSPFLPSGTFAGLPEGKHLTAAGRIFRITYQGGAGTDVALIAADGIASITGFIANPGAGPGGDQTSVNVSATGAFGLSYALEASEDLAAWISLEQKAAGPAGALSFTMLEPSTTPRRFYRLRAQVPQP